jgi:hypothetical protein
MAIVRKSLAAIKAAAPAFDKAVSDAVSEDDIRRHAVEDARIRMRRSTISRRRRRPCACATR